MIAVEKPDTAPTKLLDGEPLAQDNRAAFESDQQAYENGSKKFEFESSIYGHACVRHALQTAQYRKCCYCESLIGANAPGDVEHYRPKAYSQQKQGSAKNFPGYYWLAYDWSNLYYSCQICNRSNKRNLFPIQDEDERARKHSDDLSRESPLIVDPGGVDDPRMHIRFHGELAKGVTCSGKTTIKVLCLNRALLFEERLRRYQELRRLFDVRRLLEDSNNDQSRRLFEEASKELEAAARPDSGFSAMATDCLAELGVRT